jgi:mercuric ion transport protein
MITKASNGETFWQRHSDKIGAGGTIFAALCCLGFPPLVAFLAAIGVGFLVNDAILIPLLLVFLLISLGGLWMGMKGHHRPWALALGAVSAAAILIFILALPNGALAALGVVGLIVASGLNVWFRAQQMWGSTRA